MRVSLERIAVPAIDVPLERPLISHDELRMRCGQLHEAAGCDWVAVYGDKEHYANLLFLIDFDPRFEEALLLLGPGGSRYLIAGSEGMIYGGATGVPAELVRYQPLSLMGQPLSSPSIGRILNDLGIRRDQRVGIAGWKWQDDSPRIPAWAPAHIVDALREASGQDPVDVTSVLLDPQSGLRVRNTAAQLAQFEWGAARSSAGILNIVRNARPGMTEHDLARFLDYAGEPMSTHLILSSSDRQLNGLRSATSRVVGDGDAAVAGVGYWGGLCARAGLVTARVDETFVRQVVEPYYRAIATWWSTAAIGVSGGALYQAVIDALGDAPFRPLLNPGHLTGHDEWIHSFVGVGDSRVIQSGMVFQADIIPAPVPPGQAINCEDTVAFADEQLRNELREQFPEVWSRIEARRAAMANLGIKLSADALPLSTAPAFLAPFWGDHELVCTVA